MPTQSEYADSIPPPPQKDKVADEKPATKLRFWRRSARPPPVPTEFDPEFDPADQAPGEHHPVYPTDGSSYAFPMKHTIDKQARDADQSHGTDACQPSTSTVSSTQPGSRGTGPSKTGQRQFVPVSHYYELPSAKEDELKRLYQLGQELGKRYSKMDMNKAKEDKLKRLYHKLDVNNDGTIDIKDLTQALHEYVPHITKDKAPRYAKRIFKRATDREDSPAIDFSEFVHYVLEHEKRLALLFRDLDSNSDGVIDLKEIRSYCQKLGINVTDAEAEKMVMKMTRNGQPTIDLEEFQRYLLFYPSTSPLMIATFFKHNLVIDIGEDQALPEDFTEKEMAGGVWWRHLLAGGLAGAVSRSCTAPLDRLKVYMQVHAGPRHMTVAQSFAYLYAEGGMKSLWRGNGINVVKIAPESAIKFMAYEKCKRFIRGEDDEIGPFQRLLAGSMAGVISQTSIYPMEVLKTRLALRRTGELNRGIANTARTLYQQEGWRVFYRGYVPNIMGIIPYAGIDLAVYETLKQAYLDRYATTEDEHPPVLAVLGCGTCSSTCGMVTAYPLALIRTRLQAVSIPTNKYVMPTTMYGQLSKIVQHEGFLGLYTGLFPNIMKVIPAVSISYVVYEQVRNHLGATMT